MSARTSDTLSLAIAIAIARGRRSLSRRRSRREAEVDLKQKMKQTLLASPLRSAAGTKSKSFSDVTRGAATLGLGIWNEKTC